MLIASDGGRTAPRQAVKPSDPGFTRAFPSACADPDENNGNRDGETKRRRFFHHATAWVCPFRAGITLVTYSTACVAVKVSLTKPI